MTSAAPSGPAWLDELRALRRSREDRVVAGVLGGLARHLNIDPVLLRVVTVLLALFGGSGLLIYALGWLLIPAESEQQSVLDQALRRPHPRTSTVLLAAALVMVMLMGGFGVFEGFHGAALLVLAVAAVVLMLRRGAAPPAPPAEPREGWMDDPWPDVTDHDAAARAWAEAGGVQDDAVLRDTYAVAPVPASRPRSILGPATVGTALLAVGVLGALESAGAVRVPVAGYIALALAVVGAGLLVGTRFGRSRGLVVLGVVLALALVPATAASYLPSFEEGRSVLEYESASQVRGVVQHGIGEVEVDLSGVDFTDQRRSLTVEQAAGELVVIVPPTVDVEAYASVKAGDADLFGDVTRDGFDVSISNSDTGADGPGGGRLRLDLQLGVGDLEVRRAQA